MVERETFDIAIAGGSLAGVLTALRIRLIAPHLRVVILEQEDHLGGRLVSMVPAGAPSSGAPSGDKTPPENYSHLAPKHTQPKYFGYGLNYLSDPLMRYWTQCLQGDWSHDDDTIKPDDETFANISTNPLDTFKQLTNFGILAGSKISEIPLGDFLGEKSAKALGGPAAVRDWIHVTQILEKADSQEPLQDPLRDGLPSAEESETQTPPSSETSKQTRPQTIGQLWSGARKSPAAVILEHLANLCGIPDLWSAAPCALKARSQRLSEVLYSGDLASALRASTLWADSIIASRPPQTTPPEEPIPKTSITQTQNMILSAKWTDLHWELRCERNVIFANTLVVAQSPWNALHWLPKGFWPAHLLQIALKTKPVSLVVLSEQILDPNLSLPDLCLIPGERTQFIVTEGAHGIREISFQATIDYELSMQAPAVIKAVKALKRSRKKLLALYPGVLSEFNHIALQPDAWAQSPALTDLKWLQRLGTKPLATPHLAFVGDAYGPSHHGDSNILSSVAQAVSVLAEKNQSSMIPSFSVGSPLNL